MTRELRCADAGMDCEGVIQGETDDEVMQKAAPHVKESHPDLQLDEGTVTKLRSLIHDV